MKNRTATEAATGFASQMILDSRGGEDRDGTLALFSSVLAGQTDADMAEAYPLEAAIFEAGEESR